MNKKSEIPKHFVSSTRIEARLGAPPAYDMVQICQNGHLINLHALTKRQFNKKYCPECGGRVIDRCQKCHEPIKGPYLKDETYDNVTWLRPSFCENCGKSFPWTAKALKAARTITDGLFELNDEEKTEIKKDISEMVKNTPGALSAAARFKTTLEDKYSKIPPLYRDALTVVVPIAVNLFLGWR